MNWKWKALLQGVLSTVPGGETINYVCQRYLTKNLPLADVQFRDHVHYAKTHFDAISRHYSGTITDATFYEFGTGWDMIIPLAYYAFGVKRQILVDVRPLLRISLANMTIERLQKLPNEEKFTRTPTKNLEGNKKILFKQLKENYQIEYRAPCDPKNTGIKSSSVDCITSTSTLEHICYQELKPILYECRRILRDGGIMSFLIDYMDHYSYFDTKISRFNYLQYSDQHWERFSPALHYQNRLRHRDYLELLYSVGFEVLEERYYGGKPSDVELIRSLPLDRRFTRYTPEELAVSSALVVARKQSG